VSGFKGKKSSQSLTKLRHEIKHHWETIGNTVFKVDEELDVALHI